MYQALPQDLQPGDRILTEDGANHEVKEVSHPYPDSAIVKVEMTCCAPINMGSRQYLNVVTSGDEYL